MLEVDGARQHRHANHLRKYHVKVEEITVDLKDFDLADTQGGPESSCVDGITEPFRVTNCAVISDLDQDFGQIKALDVEKLSSKEVPELPSKRIAPEQIQHLSPKRQKELLAVLDKYPDVFSDSPGFCTEVEHEVKLRPNYQSKRFKAYRVPERLKPAVQRQIQEMLELGVIKESKSDMVSPLVVVLKGKTEQDGIRMAVNYKYLNSFTVIDPYPVPNIESLIQKVGKSKLISTFDCSSAYWATPVKEEHQPLTAFTCDEGIFEFTRTPYGMTNSGPTWCRLIQQVLKPIQHFAASYVDDIICHTQSGWYLHLQQIDEFLQTIRRAHLTLKLRKCKFCMPETKFCGRIIGSGSKRPDPEKVLAVQNLGPARTKTQVRQILGLFSFFRDHVPRFAELAKPLTDLTAKKVPNLVPWTDVHTQALEQLKQALCQATRLYIADFQKPFNLFVDASDYAIAGILTQTSDGQGELPIAFYSSKLTSTQRAWAVIEKEAYAVIASLRKFRYLVWGSSEIHVFSDHNPLSYLAESCGKSAKLMRWFLSLSEFNIRFHYRAGSQNKAADCLSRQGAGESK